MSDEKNYRQTMKLIFEPNIGHQLKLQTTSRQSDYQSYTGSMDYNQKWHTGCGTPSMPRIVVPIITYASLIWWHKAGKSGGNEYTKKKYKD